MESGERVHSSRTVESFHTDARCSIVYSADSPSNSVSSTCSRLVADPKPATSSAALTSVYVVASPVVTTAIRASAADDPWVFTARLLDESPMEANTR